MLKLHVMRGLAVIAMAVGAVVGQAGVAGAVSAVPATGPTATSGMAADPACNNNGTSSWDGWGWIPDSSNHLYGIRAPVKRRVDGLLCTDTGNDSTSSVWIAIQSTVAEHFVQIGFIHKFVNGAGTWCRFWENNNNLPQSYDCGTDSDDTQVYFKIEQQCTAFGCTYVIYDCGTGGNFTNCNPMDSSIPLFSSPEAAVNSEAHFWCVVRMMGQGSDRVWYGNDTWATSIEDNSGWSKNRNWGNYGGNQCTSDYMKDNAGGGLLRTWDSRNTS